jgi:hypothetical protein
MLQEEVVAFERNMGIILSVNNKKRNTTSVQYPLAEKREFCGIFEPFLKTEYAEGVRPSDNQVFVAEMSLNGIIGISKRL